MKRAQQGFTLIELLIVIAIIAILALIAIPNFLEAQTRSKVSRARADMRTIATGLEGYFTDYGVYPPNDYMFVTAPEIGYSTPPFVLTTPIAYLTTKEMIDPFAVGDKKEFLVVDPSYSIAHDIYYTYMRIERPKNATEFNALQVGLRCPREAVDYTFGPINRLARQRYGFWRLVCKGPDKVYTDQAHARNPLAAPYGSDILYDPSNGTMSFGNILRTHKDTRGAYDPNMTDPPLTQ